VARLVFASLITFGLLIGMVAGLVLAALVASGEVNLTLAIVLTVVINLFIWLISPWLSDLTLRWFNQLEFLDDAAVRERYPGIHQLIHQVAGDYRFKAPRIGFIPRPQPDRLHLWPVALECAHRRYPRHLRVLERGRTARRGGA
jgi:heat shock protein HtpX